MKEVIEKLDAMSEESKANKASLEAKMTEQVEGVKNEFTGQIKVVSESIDRVKADVDAMMKKNGRSFLNGEKKSFADQLGEAMEAKKEALANYSKNDRKQVSLELKVVGDMGSGNLTTSGTETFAGNTNLGGVGRKPYEATHVRNLLSVRAISTDSAYFIRDAAGEGGPTAVAQAAVKPQSDRDYVKLIAPVTKIAHWFKIPEEMLADNAWMQAEISAVGVEDLLAKEDDLILNQASGAGLFAGLTTTTNSTAYASPASLALLVPAPNNYDVLVAAWTQLRNLKNSATAVLVNPSDYAAMILSKASDGQYVFGAPNIAIPNIFGVPVIPHTAIASDKFLMGDFSKVALGQRAGVSVRFYDQNEDDAIYNMVTVVIEERITVLADRADRLIYGDFSDAITALTKPA